MKAWSAVALLFAWASIAVAQTPQCGINDRMVTISFGHAVTDDDAAAFLIRHQLTPGTGYLWAAGSPLSVSIAAAAPGSFVASVRAAAESARIAHRAEIMAQAGSFVAQHSRGELVRDLALAEEGKEILRQATRDDALVTRVRASKPLIWAFTVCAAPATLADITAAEGVEVTEGAVPARPEELSSRYPTPRVDPLSGAETWAELVKLARP
ncbi:MAG TPA: hypothetical protein VGR02_05725 [Thermoanaerobaculia bacterium]|jgi:hypothetical protein|nr:hypothetical protein [Thermoanaerobaculia bacterium]